MRKKGKRKKPKINPDMASQEKLAKWLKLNKVANVVDFDFSADRLYPFDFTATNTELTAEVIDDTAAFSLWTAAKLKSAGCRYGIGGYAEHRNIYNRSAHFDTGEEPRRLHLGIDIWGPAGTAVYNFYDAEVHSFQYNGEFGDYGATIILQYNLGGLLVHALYGHLSKDSLTGLAEGQRVAAGQQFAFFGLPSENGSWPPHLHFQLIFDMEGRKGDYPGVCQFSKREDFLSNCPDPSLVLDYTFPSPEK